jgi:hypothetical protein
VRSENSGTSTPAICEAAERALAGERDEGEDEASRACEGGDEGPREGCIDVE